MNCQSKHRKESSGSDSGSGGHAQKRGKRPRQSYDGSRKTRHADGAQHKEIVESTSMPQVLNFPKKKQSVPDKLKRAELQLAVATCCHCSTAAIDHIIDVVKMNATGSILENLQLHRTKCTALLNSVISPSLRDELISDMKGKKFSLIVDEGTDVATEKLLAVCARYFSEKAGEIKTAFLGLYPVVRATGEALFRALTECLRDHSLAFADCIGIGCDGAAVMVGGHNSVWSRIKKESPNCVLNKCVCHSLALCIQKAFEVLPSCLGYLLIEIPGWFSHSTLQRKNYIKLFEALSEEEGENEKSKTHFPFMKASTTRWLVRGRVIKRLLENWKELEAYFKCVALHGAQDVRHKARTLHDMLHDDANYLYFLFLSPVVLELEKINAFFQSPNADPEKMQKELEMYHRDLKSRVRNRQGHKLSVAMTDFGERFANELSRCNKSGGLTVDEESVENLKQRCQKFLNALLREVENRLPGNQQLFKGLSALHPSKVLSQTARYPFEQLPFHHLLEEEQGILEKQYRKIMVHFWAEVFDGKVPDDSTSFWNGVFQYKNEQGERPYKELALYALACLSCPVSNAVVERVFSQVTCIKTKYRNDLDEFIAKKGRGQRENTQHSAERTHNTQHRNEMSVDTLNAIVRICTALSLKSGCCVQFMATDDMLRRFTSEMYESVQ